MWLINARTLALEEVVNPEEYRYAILSHRWGRDEVGFHDMADLHRARRMTGFHKIQMTCRKALEKGVPYAWVDTCCIDKTSSAALSEAINSMFRWYELSSFCFAHLFDLRRESVDLDEEDEDDADRQERLVDEMRDSQWFRRGWTLQELIAPEIVEFYDRGWRFRGTKRELRREISDITGIDVEVLLDSEELSTVAVGRRMSWASGRETTRVEDGAYCLLGIFDINMTMIYGEGPNAFLRLQEEIAKRSNDLSLFAWTAHIDQNGHPSRVSDQRPLPWMHGHQEYRGILAKSPSEFANCRNLSICRDQIAPMKEFVMSNNGCLRIETYLAPAQGKDYIFSLDCTDGKVDRDHCENRLGIHLMKTETGYVRCRVSETFSTFDRMLWADRPSPVYIRKDLTPSESSRVRIQLQSSLIFHFHTPRRYKVHKLQARPSNAWDANGRHFITSDQENFTACVQFTLKPRWWRFVIVCGLIDPRSTNPVVIGPPVLENYQGLLPWVAIYTDQDPAARKQLETIDKLAKSDDERSRARLRDQVLRWHSHRDGRLPLKEMLESVKVASDDQGEMSYSLAVRREYKDGIPVFNVVIILEEMNRLQDDYDDDVGGSNDTDPGYTPGPGFGPSLIVNTSVTRRRHHGLRIPLVNLLSALSRNHHPGGHIPLLTGQAADSPGTLALEHLLA
ncbi:HET-domain-containing protein [Coniochaeta hoffmannii]|uniref:HET-domain-containing protein n=1 Tax=Coniochaeta hoffmannii TaxID=91930 RepID=A0AA38RWS8_9PEZI|nr:HET-domain-containing protein [Coniochaeta hoffmannii]